MNIKKVLIVKIFIFYSLFFFSPLVGFAQPIRFAVIGDYGKAGPNELAVSNLVDSWNVDFIITTGDNNYEYGGASTIDTNIGYYYHEYIYPYYGIYGQGDTINRFWPSLGNHDWDSLNAQAYLNYFTLPNNERYYDFVKGYVHFFVIDSDPREPNGITSSSIQGQWIQSKLASSTARFKIVYFHHPAYSSGPHGNTPQLQWPFKLWGATCVLQGHDHVYERLNVNNFTYFTNGLGGKSIYNFGTIQPGSQVRYNGDYGAQLVTAYLDSINFKFYNKNGVLIDSYTIPYVPVSVIKMSEDLPTSFALYQNYPNPFNPVTKISFEIPAPFNSPEGGILRLVSLKVYDILGREAATIINQLLLPGKYEVKWDGSNFASGIYFYKLYATNEENKFIDVKKMILLK